MVETTGVSRALGLVGVWLSAVWTNSRPLYRRAGICRFQAGDKPFPGGHAGTRSGADSTARRAKDMRRKRCRPSSPAATSDSIPPHPPCIIHRDNRPSFRVAEKLRLQHYPQSPHRRGAGCHCRASRAGRSQSAEGYGRSVLPIRYRSHSRAAPRPSLMAQTIRLCPRRQSPAVNTPSNIGREPAMFGQNIRARIGLQRQGPRAAAAPGPMNPIASSTRSAGISFSLPGTSAGMSRPLASFRQAICTVVSDLHAPRRIAVQILYGSQVHPRILTELRRSLLLAHSRACRPWATPARDCPSARSSGGRGRISICVRLPQP